MFSFVRHHIRIQLIESVRLSICKGMFFPKTVQNWWSAYFWGAWSPHHPYTGFLRDQDFFANIDDDAIDEDSGGIRVDGGAYSRQINDWVNETSIIGHSVERATGEEAVEAVDGRAHLSLKLRKLPPTHLLHQPQQNIHHATRWWYQPAHPLVKPINNCNIYNIRRW